MIGQGGSSAGLYLADPTSPIPSHCASIVVTSTLRVNGFVTVSFTSREGITSFYFDTFTFNNQKGEARKVVLYAATSLTIQCCAHKRTCTSDVQ